MLSHAPESGARGSWDNRSKPSGAPPGKEEEAPDEKGPSRKIHGGESASSITDPADILSQARRHDYALLVTYERADRRVCTQLYTNLPAAERRVSRVLSRGLAASLQLVRLVPVSSTVDPADVMGGESL